ncbi:glycosyltransferase family 87 protein [Bradyrhizobium yuanmingense]|uniref:glycosyltransferase family 87 protein n=1 Tax=Bradyrhizobium yuanmingense TaxID=108015 RepID=UPI0023BA1D29|nr:glycosyltransferase family 87 protein [Bradyrhizobium yuanmingense]MDF0519927.1 glycosyltransferase family 87 protein [Bradyrhizobium yuanmingense]
MAEASSVPPAIGLRGEVPAILVNISFVLAIVTLAYFPTAYLAHLWIFDADGRGIPTDFVNVWAAGRLALEGHPAQAWDWDIQKQVELALLKQDFVGHFAWHYPPPFLFVASFLAQFPYTVAFIGWAAFSMVPYLAVMRAIIGRNAGLVIAVGFPAVFLNILVGQNGFLTASLIGGMLYWLPTRPVLAGICLGLLSYKPQYGLLFPLVLLAAAEWTVLFSAGIVTVAIAALSWLAFGTESWQAFFHWIPMFSQAFLTEGRAPWFKMQSIFALVRYLGGTEQLAWIFQWVLTASVAVALVVVWRSRLPYALKAAMLATAALLTTPYLFMYDLVVLGIAVAFLIRAGLDEGFARHEVMALALVFALLASFLFLGQPVGFPAILIVFWLVLGRCAAWRRAEAASAQLALTRTS